MKKSTEMNRISNQKGETPPWVSVVVAIISVIGVLGAAIITQQYRSVNSNSSQNVANANTGLPSNTGVNAAGGNHSNTLQTDDTKPKLRVEVVRPTNGETIEAHKKVRHTAAYFPVSVEISGEIPGGNLGVFILVREGDEWWIQEHKKLDIGREEIEAWSGGGSNNPPQENRPLKLRAIVADVAYVAAINKLRVSGADATELKPVALSRVVDFKIGKIHLPRLEVRHGLAPNR